MPFHKSCRPAQQGRRKSILPDSEKPDEQQGETKMNQRILMAAFAALLASHSLRGAENILVTSERSHSIEQFNTSGAWLKTFATTGPYAPAAMAQSPLTGEIFVTTELNAQLSNVILRYQANGQFDTNWDTFAVVCSAPCASAQTQSLLFDSSGNLWVATAYGEDSGLPIYIFEYLAANLTSPNPQAQPNPIVATMYRGNQMAFAPSGDLCIAGFIDEDVRCFNTSTGAQTKDYSAEIQAAGLGVEPGGLAFDAEGRLYLTSIFTGQVVKEQKKGGPIVLLATLISSPNLLNGNLALRAGNLFVPTYYFPPPTVSTPDAVYEVSAASGAIVNFIDGGEPPTLGNDHIWGALWVMFYSAPFGEP
jgi:hypothetical protein